jgi:hypothetical protein
MVASQQTAVPRIRQLILNLVCLLWFGLIEIKRSKIEFKQNTVAIETLYVDYLDDKAGYRAEFIRLVEAIQ